MSKRSFLSKILLAVLLNLAFIQQNYLAAKFALHCQWNEEKKVYYCGEGKKQLLQDAIETEFYPPLAWPVYTALYYFYPDDFVPHRGVDMIGSREVLASSSGVVSSICRYFCYGPFGQYVLIQHRDNLYTMYAHLSRVDVNLGEEVTRTDQLNGTMLGIMGETGQAQGVHLHFEVRTSPSDAFEYRQDPVRYIPVFLEECHNMFGLYDALSGNNGSYRHYYFVDESGRIHSL